MTLGQFIAWWREHKAAGRTVDGDTAGAERTAGRELLYVKDWHFQQDFPHYKVNGLPTVRTLWLALCTHGQSMGKMLGEATWIIAALSFWDQGECHAMRCTVRQHGVERSHGYRTKSWGGGGTWRHGGGIGRWRREVAFPDTEHFRGFQGAEIAACCP